MIKDIPLDKWDKLPRWAKDLLEINERRIKQLELEQEVLMEQHPESDTLVGWDWPNKMYLPNGSRVEFRVPGVEVQVHTDLEGRVRIHFEDGVIAPSARNAIHILPNKNPKGY